MIERSFASVSMISRLAIDVRCAKSNDAGVGMTETTCQSDPQDAVSDSVNI